MIFDILKDAHAGHTQGINGKKTPFILNVVLHTVIINSEIILSFIKKEMETFQVDILNPKAKKLLQDLVDLNLITIKKTKRTDISTLLANLRSKSTEEISLEEITKEVENVRKSRYEM